MCWREYNFIKQLVCLGNGQAYSSTQPWTCPKRILCFRASVLSSLGWQKGSWTLTKKQCRLVSWGARLHARMLGVRRGPVEDIGSFWMRMHRMGHQNMKLHNTSPVSTFRGRNTEWLVTSHVSANHTFLQITPLW